MSVRWKFPSAITKQSAQTLRVHSSASARSASQAMGSTVNPIPAVSAINTPFAQMARAFVSQDFLETEKIALVSENTSTA